MENVINIENGYKIIVSKRMYEKETVVSVAYKFCNDFIISLDDIDDDYLAFVLQKRYNSKIPSMEDAERVFDELIDEQLRLEIYRRTKVIREIIYKKSFAPLQDK